MCIMYIFVGRRFSVCCFSNTIRELTMMCCMTLPGNLHESPHIFGEYGTYTNTHTHTKTRTKRAICFNSLGHCLKSKIHNWPDSHRGFATISISVSLKVYVPFHFVVDCSFRTQHLFNFESDRQFKKPKMTEYECGCVC